jgi:hypothetical protein
MKKNIHKIASAVIILIIISNAVLAFAQGKPEQKSVETDVLIRSFPEQEFSIREFLVKGADTRKAVRKFLFRGAPQAFKFNMDKDSLLLKLDSVLKYAKIDVDSLIELSDFPHERMFFGRSDNSIEIPNMLRSFHQRKIDMDDRLMPSFVEPERKNSQSFNFRNTDNDGITTRLSIELYEPTKPQMEKALEKASEGVLTVSDLTFIPHFSFGKIAMSFTLPAKGAVHVKILSNDYNVIYNDVVQGFTGTYMKSVALPKNGIYYLVITQDNRSFVKRMLKLS